MTPEDYVDDSGDLTPYDFRELERKARYNALPADIKECLEAVKEELAVAAGWQPEALADLDSANWQLLDYLGAL